MKIKNYPLLLVLVLLSPLSAISQSYNSLWIPDTLAGPSFNLRIKDTFAQISPGNQTVTGGINGKFWGPTLIFKKGDTVRMNVVNKLNDSTTLHWHGMHLPAIMDGGPHQIIPPGTTWKPYWKVTNDAGTFWYHPHLHEMAQEQITKGIGGMIIVRDDVESKLALPRTYGVDDIPLVFTGRSFTSGNQFSIVPYGDSPLVNMTLRPQIDLPAQMVRFRMLNAAVETSYNVGFSDTRSFYIIATDGGLVDKPVLISGSSPRILINAGERVEILVDLGSDQGKSIFLKAYNSTLGRSIPGGEDFSGIGGPFKSYIGGKDYNLLKIYVKSKNSNAITKAPTSLTTNTFWAESSSNITRNVSISDSQGVKTVKILGPNAFILNHTLFNYNKINYTVPFNSTEIWSITNSGVFGHPFHIHESEFYILDRKPKGGSASAPSDYEKGWKDVVLVKSGETVRFIIKFNDYADSLHPYMYHCHIALHEDEGMMGQFVVSNKTSSIENLSIQKIDFTIHPNPVTDRLTIDWNNPSIPYYLTITDVAGRTLLMQPKPLLNNNSIDVSTFKAGIYFINITNDADKKVYSKKFIVR